MKKKTEYKNDDVGKVVVGRMAVRTILDRKGREEISAFEKRPKKNKKSRYAHNGSVPMKGNR